MKQTQVFTTEAGVQNTRVKKAEEPRLPQRSTTLLIAKKVITQNTSVLSYKQFWNKGQFS